MNHQQQYNCICILMIDEELVEGRRGSGFFASLIKKPGKRTQFFVRTEVEPTPASTRTSTTELPL